MATYYTDIGTKQNDPVFGSRIDGYKKSGNVYYSIAKYAITSSNAANDVIKLVKLKPGSIVVPALSSVYTPGGATTLTIDIGDDDSSTAVDPDRYADGINLATAGIITFNSGTIAAAAKSEYKLAQESWVEAKIATLTSVTNTSDMVFFIAYIA